MRLGLVGRTSISMTLLLASLPVFVIAEEKRIVHVNCELGGQQWLHKKPTLQSKIKAVPCGIPAEWKKKKEEWVEVKTVLGQKGWINESLLSAAPPYRLRALGYRLIESEQTLFYSTSPRSYTSCYGRAEENVADLLDLHVTCQTYGEPSWTFPIPLRSWQVYQVLEYTRGAERIVYLGWCAGGFAGRADCFMLRERSLFTAWLDRDDAMLVKTSDGVARFRIVSKRSF